MPGVELAQWFVRYIIQYLSFTGVIAFMSTAIGESAIGNKIIRDPEQQLVIATRK
jgi:hypothetical protein